MLVLFVGWGGFFIYCLVRFRQSRNPVADYAYAVEPVGLAMIRPSARMRMAG